MNSVLSSIPTVAKNDRASNVQMGDSTFHFSPNPVIDAAIQGFRSRNFSTLPVAPAFPASEYPSKKDPSKPRFNGKNPSYIGSNGKPYEVKDWEQFADRLPTEAELKKWFSHKDVGLGRVAVSVDRLQRVADLDFKHFGSTERFTEKTAAIAQKSPNLTRTPSGGFHFDIELEADPLEGTGKAQMNIGLGDVAHAGELPLFVVDAPTPGYVVEKAGPALKVKSLDDLGLYPSSKQSQSTKGSSEPPKLKAVPRPSVALMPGMVSLEALIWSGYRPILSGHFEGDRSKALSDFAKECFGWENLASPEGIAITPPLPLIQQAAAALGCQDKWERVIETIGDRSGLKSVQEKKAGRSKALARLRMLSVKASKPEGNKGLRKLNKLELYDFLEGKFKIEFDTWKGEILIDGDNLDIENLHIKLAVEFGIDVGKESVIDTVQYIASQNERDDVLDYLRSLEEAEPLPAELWDRIAQFCLGSSDPFDSIILQRTLISGVGRVYDPGCKVDECLVLQGPQGLGKSTCFEVLAGRDFFTDELGDFAGPGKKDAHQKLRTNWFVEIAELDKITARREAGELKSFITTKVDDYRPPYARANKKFKRRNVFIGTVNPSQFLNDATGNRRYPVIRVSRRIDLEKIAQYRDQIWASAVQAYKRGERWWYDSEETALINKRAEAYEFEDPWELEILNYVEGLDYTTVRGIFEFALKMEPGKAGNRESARVCKILNKFGWRSGDRRRVDGQLVSPWYPPVTPCQAELESAETAEQIEEIEARYSISQIGEAERRMEPRQREKLEEIRHSLSPEKLAAQVEEFEQAAELGTEVLASFVPLFKEMNPITKRQIWAALPKTVRAKVNEVTKNEHNSNSNGN